MRQVISVSLPAPLVKQLKKTTKSRGYRSMSAYMQSLLLADQKDMISAKELIKIAAEARAAYKRGDVIHANSLRELL